MLTHHHHRRPGRPRWAEAGFTLTELLIVMLLLGIIIAPLSGAFVNSVRATRDVDQRLTNAFESQLLANYWTSDVQSAEGPANPGLAGVIDDPADPNDDPDPASGVCGGLTQDATDEFPLLTLQWGLPTAGRPAATAKPVRVSYVVEGDGTASVITRRLCFDSNEAESEIVASGYGVQGQTAQDMVYGADPTRPYLSVCTNTTCTVTVKGSANFTLTVERRVRGTGTDTGQQPPSSPASVTARGLNKAAFVEWPKSPRGANQPRITRYQVLAYADTPTVPGICTDPEAPDDAPAIIFTPELPFVPPGSPELATMSQYVPDGSQLPELVNGNGYCFRVRAYNVAGWSKPSPPSNIVVPAPGPPGPVAALTAVASDRTLTVTWNPPPNDGGFSLTGYQLSIVVDGTSTPPAGLANPYPVALSPTAPVKSVIGCPETCLINGTKYKIEVWALNTSPTNGGLGDSRTTTGTPYGPADAPTNVQARGGGAGSATDPASGFFASQTAFAQWTSPATLQGGRLWGYRIDAYSPGSATPDVTGYVPGTEITSGTVKCSPTGIPTPPCLVNGKPYEIRVSAVTTTAAVGTNCQTTPTLCTVGRQSTTATTLTPAGGTTVVPSGKPAPPSPLQVLYALDSNVRHQKPAFSWTDTRQQPAAGATDASWNGAQPVGYTLRYRKVQRWSVSFGSPPAVGDYGNSGAWTTVNVSGNVLDTLTLPGGYYYQFQIAARNRGEWFAAGSPDRLGDYTDWNVTAIDDLGRGAAQGATPDSEQRSVLYVVTKPEPPGPTFTPVLVDTLETDGAIPCMSVRPPTSSTTFQWMSEGAHLNGIGWDYARLVVKIARYPSSVPAPVIPPPGPVPSPNADTYTVAVKTFNPRSTVAADDTIGFLRVCSAALRRSSSGAVNETLTARVAWAGYDTPGNSLLPGNNPNFPCSAGPADPLACRIVGWDSAQSTPIPARP